MNTIISILIILILIVLMVLIGNKEAFYSILRNMKEKKKRIMRRIIRRRRRRRRRLRTDPSLCNNISNFCGGSATSTPISELSCTPFMYNPSVWQGNWDICNTWQDFNGNLCKTYHEVVCKENARMWADMANDPNTYFVFHSNDHAGIQSDCLGDSGYIEKFVKNSNVSSLSDTGQLVPNQNKNYNIISPINKNVCMYNNPPKTNTSHNFCKFTHPGTFITYGDYWSGWFSNGTIRCSDFGAGSCSCDDTCFNTGTSSCNSSETCRPWSDNIISFLKNNPHIRTYDNTIWEGATDDNTFIFMTYGWVCGRTDNIGQERNFSFPHVDSDLANSTKCYADNEPTPLAVEINHCYIVDNNTIYHIRYNLDLTKNPISYTRYPNNGYYTLKPDISFDYSKQQS